MISKYNFLNLLFLILVCVLPLNGFAQDAVTQKTFDEILTIMSRQQSKDALVLTDSILLSNPLSKEKHTLFQLLKVEILIKAELYTDAIQLSENIANDIDLLPASKQMMYHIQRAVMFEIFGRFDASEMELNKVREFYKNNPKDAIYGRYLYRKSSLFRVSELPMRNRDSAIYFAEKALKFGRNIKHYQTSGTGALLLGLIYDNQEKSYTYFKESLKDFKKINYSDAGNSYSVLASKYLEDKKYKLSRMYADSALALGIKTNQFYLKAAGHLHISEISEKINQHDSALYHYKKHTALHDSIALEKQAVAIHQVEVKSKLKLQNQEKEAAIAALNDTKKINYFLIGFAIFLGIALAGAIYFSTRKRSDNKKLKSQRELIDKQNASLTEAVQQKQLLLKEIHHRVKNNLQIINGLLMLEEFESNDERLQKVLNKAQGRVDAMSLVHELLYQKDELGHIPVGNYLELLANNIKASAGNSTQIKIDAADFEIVISKAIPLGLIVNELITNSIKYCHSDEAPCAITINVKHTNGKAILVYRDSGGGYDFKTLSSNNATMGTRLLGMLSDELNGVLIGAKNGDSTFKLTFDI